MEGIQNISKSLILAVSEGRIEVAKQLINSYGLDYSKDWLEGYTLLNYALHNNHAEVAKLLLVSGSKVNDSSLMNITTPLHLAVRNSNIEVVKMLLDKGAFVNAEDNIGNTPLFYAIEKLDVKLTKLLLSNRANIKDNPELLINAVKKNCVALVAAIMHYDVDINAADESGWTALHFTASKAIKNSFDFLTNEEPIIYVKTEMTKLLLTKGANINAKTKNGLTALHIATQSRYQEVIKVLLEYNADINTSDIYERTALHFSAICEISNPPVCCFIHDSELKITGEIAKLLLINGANVDAKTRSSKTTLHLAAENGYIKVVEALLQCNANINAIEKYGRTALHFTALNDLSSDSCLIPSIEDHFINIKAEIARLLLSKNADVNAEAYRDLTTLHAATEAGFLQVVEVLLEYNADVNICDINGITALHYTSVKGSQRPVRYIDSDVRAKIAKLLLSKGANVNAQTNSGLTTLHAATQRGFLEVVEVLLEYHADINVCDVNGITALHYTVGKKSQRPVGNNNIDVKAETIDGLPTLRAASEIEFLDVLRALLEYEGDINIYGGSELTALHYIIGRGNLSPVTDDDDDDEVIDIDIQAKIAKLLLSNGANVDAISKDGVTALHVVTTKGNEKIVETLLEHNANVNCRLSNGFTPLHIAAQNGFQEIINIILKYGADVNSVDKYNRTALFIASVKKYHNVATTLLDHDAKFNFVRIHNETYLIPDLGESNRVNMGYCFYFNNNPGNIIYPESNFLDEEVLDVYKRQVIKLETANLYVSKKISKVLRCDNMTKYKAECEKEIANMKSEKIGNSNISFYDILVKDTTLIAKCIRNENIVQVLKSKNYKTKFPGYAEKIACNFEKAMYTKQLQEIGIEIFHLFFNTTELPHDCIEKIVNHLNYEDMKTLFNTCKHNQEIRWSIRRNNNL